MRHPADELRTAAEAVVTKEMRTSHLELTAARRAMRRCNDFFAVILLGNFTENLWNDVIRTANVDEAAEGVFEVFALDVADVIERTVLHRYACEINSFNAG
ncbi:hypothetical protein D3C86_1836640 [compost metagenome]